MSCLETLFIPSKSYNLLSGCAQSNLVRRNSTHIESNIHRNWNRKPRQCKFLEAMENGTTTKEGRQEMLVVKRNQTACSQWAQPQLSHHRRNGSQDLNFQWLQNLLETLSQTILLSLQNHTPFPRLIINQGSRPGDSCKNFFRYFSFFHLWSGNEATFDFSWRTWKIAHVTAS